MGILAFKQHSFTFLGKMLLLFHFLVNLDNLDFQSPFKL